jgi:plastocyanin
MTKYLLVAATIFTGAAGCGDDDGGNPIDAAAIDTATVDTSAIDTPTVIDGPTIDTPPSTVQVVDCAGATIASEVTTPGFNFAITDNTINVNQIVRFTIGAGHTAVSGTNGTPDGRFNVGNNAPVCLRFTEAGSYPFYCNPHLFSATLTVAP